MGKVWSKIPDSHYSVSSHGEVRNDLTGQIKTPHPNNKGYYDVHLYDNSKRTIRRIHRLVAEAFIPNQEGKPCINHIDGDKLNNNVDNLEWVTHSENMKHAFGTGLAKPHPSYGMRGRKNPNGGSKGKPIVCVTTNEEFSSTKQASEFFGITQSSIWDCLHGLRYYTHGLHFEFV